MIELNLHQAGTLSKTFQFPSEWNDLSLKQLHLVASVFLREFEDQAQAKACMFLTLLHSVCGKKVKNIVNRLDAEDATLNGAPTVDFLTTENNLTKQPYKKLWLPFSWKTFIAKVSGPADDFNDLTVGEFEDTEMYFNEFKANPNGESLANLAAVLYRPGKKRYLRKHRWNGSWIFYKSEKLYPQFKKLSALELYTIYLWYSGCREQLPKYFPEVFDGPQTQNDEPDLMVITNCIHNAAGPKNGLRNEVRITLLKEFMQEMKLQKIEIDRQIAEMEKQRNG